MNKIAIGFLSGTIGLIVGSVGSYIFFKKKYTDLYYEKLQEAIDEECESLRERHAFVSTGEKMLEKAKEDIIKETVTENPYHEILNNLKECPPPETVDGVDGPRFIDEEEFRFLDSRYDIREYQYLSRDGTLLDENDETILNPEIYISGLEDVLKDLPPLSHTYILVDNMSVAIDMVILDDSYNSLFGIE